MKKSLYALLILLAGCMWGTMGLYVRHLTAAGMTSMQISWIRSIGSCLLFALILLIKDRSLFRFRLRDIWCFLGTGIASVTVFNYCYFQTINLTSLSVAAILLYTAPVIVMLLSAPLFKEKLTPKKLIALAATMAGCVLVTGVLTSAPVLNPLGILTGLMAGFGYALYSIFSRYAMNRGYHTLTINFYTFCFSALALTPLAGLPGLFGIIREGQAPWLWIVLLILIASVGPYLLYTLGLTETENGKAAILASTEPVMAAFLGIVVFHEAMDWMTLCGIAFVLGAIVLLNLPVRSKPVQTELSKSIPDQEKEENHD
ncbi:MAG: EamA family transporter [Clostridia bacterium]|nr:EamA family transporter [Clostridia bacterium]